MASKHRQILPWHMQSTTNGSSDLRLKRDFHKSLQHTVYAGLQEMPLTVNPLSQ